MKLYLFSGSAADDFTNNLDWFVVADSFDRAKELWAATAEEYLDREVEPDELTQARVIIEDASALPVAAQGERAIPWDEFEIVFTGAQ